ncbi:MAG: FecCD family ABC transporter permease [Thermoprotei archaeon]
MPRRLMKPLLALVFLASFFLSIMIGPVRIPASAVAGFFFDFLPWFSKPTAVYWDIIYYLRLPRVILALLVGASLAMGGVVVQAMFRNPMAEPYVIGLSSGAALGASLASTLSLYFLGPYTMQIMAFVFALLSTFLVYALARALGPSSVIGTSSGVLLLSGIAVSLLFGSLSSFVIYVNAAQRPEVIFWLLGSLADAEWQEIPFVFGIVAICALALYAFRRDLDALSLGDEDALYVGVNVKNVKVALMSITALMVATVVSVSGLIGFVGLMIPHMTRMSFGSAHRVLLPFSAIMGGVFLLLCDDLARTAMAPLEIPIGIITAFVGVPFFFVLLKKRGYGERFDRGP